MKNSEFRQDRLRRIHEMVRDKSFGDASREWFASSVEHHYSYNFDWLGLPAIQYPQDTLFLQELIWSAKPDLIVETGVARGGSLILSASLMVLLKLEKAGSVDLASPGQPTCVVGVELALSDENRHAIMNHALAPCITLVDGSSTDVTTVSRVRQVLSDNSAVSPFVILDSNHSHEHVLEELFLYSEFVQVGGYIVVMDTVIESLAPELHDPSRWGIGNNPMSAVEEFIEQQSNFVIDETFTKKLMISAAPRGVLKRVC